MKFLREENVTPFAKIAKLDFFLDLRNLFIWITSFRDHPLLAICLSNNSIKFTENIWKIKRISLKPFPWGNCAIEFPRNILKVAKIDSREIFVKDRFVKIDSREILGKAQMAKINYSGTSL